MRAHFKILILSRLSVNTLRVLLNGKVSQEKSRVGMNIEGVYEWKMAQLIEQDKEQFDNAGPQVSSQHYVWFTSFFLFTLPVWCLLVCFLSFRLFLHSINCPCQIGHEDMLVLSHVPKTTKSCILIQEPMVCLRIIFRYY